MVHLNEDENRAYYIHLLEYVEEEQLDEEEEEEEVDDDDELVEQVHMVDNDAYHQEDIELPFEVDNNF
jgi:hypothetical protein